MPEGARERSIRLFADDRVARVHLIGQVLVRSCGMGEEASNLDI